MPFLQQNCKINDNKLKSCPLQTTNPRYFKFRKLIPIFNYAVHSSVQETYCQAYTMKLKHGFVNTKQTFQT